MFKEYIWTKESSLTNVFCNHVIDKFQIDPLKHDGKVNTLNPRVDKTVKLTVEIDITTKKNWQEEDKVLYNSLKFALEEYNIHLLNIGDKINGDGEGRKIHPANGFEIKDTGYKIQKYEPNCYYHWHHDWDLNQGWSRIFTYIWYLNTIEEKNGGWTEFVDGTKIQPKSGSILMFPANWTFVHRGYTTKVPKYIIVGWIYGQPQR